VTWQVELLVIIIAVDMVFISATVILSTYNASFVVPATHTHQGLDIIIAVHVHSRLLKDCSTADRLLVSRLSSATRFVGVQGN